MTENNDFFALISRMRYITRWSLMRNAENENIQEHSHMVAVIAHALAVIRRDVYGIPCDPNEYATVALYHDASEILTGDMPTPIKYQNDKIMNAYHEVEDLASEKLLNMLPVEIRSSFEPILTGEVVERTYPLVKAADKFSAYIKCIEERKAGNNEFVSAEASTRKKLEEYDLPEVKYFLDNFIPAFEKTLDELGKMEDDQQAKD